MLQNLNRKLRTSLWQVPVQWKALRRVPGWTYAPAPVAKLTVPHQHLYPLLFERLPLLRLEGHRLGEVAVESSGNSTAGRTLTQRMVLRWWQLIQSKTEANQATAFERVRKEFEPHLQQYAEYLTKAKAAAVSRHAQLEVAKETKDALDVELGRPERYAEHLEVLVNRALHRHPNDSHQYFSPNVSRKLIKLVNKKKIKDRLVTKTEVLKDQLENSALGRRAVALVGSQGDSALQPPSPFDQPLSSFSAAPQPMTLSTSEAEQHPIAAMPADAHGEPLPCPELFFHVEKEWATSIQKEQASVGVEKDRRVTELVRHLDEMHAEPNATLADYLAYVLYTQIVTLQLKKLQPWVPYTHYLNSRIFFHAYRLLNTAIKRSTVVIPAQYPLMPLVRHVRMSKWTFQQSLTHQRLLVLIQNHLNLAPLHSYREDDAALAEADEDAAWAKPRELPLTPFWQEVMDEKVRIKHPGESWYNARLEETIKRASEDQEYERLEQEAKAKWMAQKAARAEAAATAAKQ